VDLDRLLDLQQERFVALGGRFLAGEAQLRAEGDRTAVLVGGSTILPDHVVVAAGGATPSVLAQIGLQLPARTNTGSVLTIPGAGDSVRSILRGPDISVRRTVNGDLLVHSERLDGALAQTDTLPSGRDLTAESVADDPHVWTVLNAVIDAVESLISRRTDRGQVRLSFGQRPIPADGLPVLGPVGPGIHVLFSHSGATLSLVLADLLASQLLDGTDPAILRGFRPERFGLRG
jgi:glycine/D-amino acid oxidase-like deaminating enzyme